jgi:4-hydroxy-tetrahydrodipicolinate synthase
VSEAEFLRGVYNVAPTPFHPNGDVDEESIRRLTDFLLERGVDGITILGVDGEAEKVSDVERGQIIAKFIEAADDRIPICVGTSHAATDRCVAFSREAELLGARAVMVAPPRLTRSSNEALRRHYLAVAASIDVPIVMQDYPAASGIYMSPEFFSQIADDTPQCRYIKLEDDPTPVKITRVLSLNPSLNVFGSSGGMMFLEELVHGIVGVMTGFAYSEILVDIYCKFRDGDIEGATEVFNRYCSIIRFEFQRDIGLAIRKYIYYKRGAIASPSMREPYVPIDDSTIEDLNRVLSSLCLL